MKAATLLWALAAAACAAATSTVASEDEPAPPHATASVSRTKTPLYLLHMLNYQHAVIHTGAQLFGAFCEPFLFAGRPWTRPRSGEGALADRISPGSCLLSPYLPPVRASYSVFCARKLVVGVMGGMFGAVGVVGATRGERSRVVWRPADVGFYFMSDILWSLFAMCD